MLKISKWFGLILVGAMLLSACSSGSVPAASPATGSGDSQPQAQAPKYTIDGTDVTALYAAAMKEGRLMYYGGAYPTDQTNMYVEEFKKRFPGIEVEVFRATTPAVLERFLSEARAGKFIADVLFQGDPYTLKGVIKEGYLMEYALTSASNFEDKFITDKFVYPHSVVYLGPVYNTNLVKGADEEALRKSWKFTADPKWKGKVAISVPESGGTSYGPVYMFLGEKRSEFGPEFIKGLQQNVKQVFTSTVPAHAQVSAGEFAIHVHGQTATTGGQLAQGAPIRIAFPSPTPAVPVGAAIVGKAPHPNTAKLFLEWAFSKEGQEKMVEHAASHSLRKDVTTDPFSKYDWYEKPTDLWMAQDLDAYMKGLTGLAGEWHQIMGTKK